MEGVFKLKKFDVHYNNEVFKITTDSILLGAFVDCNNAEFFLDIGTGTGIIALILAQRFTLSNIYAIDISESAFYLAKKNFQNSPWSDRLIAVLGDIKDYDFNGLAFDCIVSNPPFYKNALLSEKEVDRLAKHDISLAYADLAKAIVRLLKDQGKAFIIIPYAEYKTLEQTFNFEYLFCEQKIFLYSVENKPPKRVIMSFRKYVCACNEENFYIKQGEKFSEEYVNLLKDFYINF